MRATERASHVAHLKPMSCQVQRVRLQEIETGHIMASEVTQLSCEISLGEPPARRASVSRARAGKAREKLRHGAVEVGSRIPIDEITAVFAQRIVRPLLEPARWPTIQRHGFAAGCGRQSASASLMPVRLRCSKLSTFVRPSRRAAGQVRAS